MTLEAILQIFNQAESDCRIPEFMKPLNFHRCCVSAPLNWETLPLLPNRLKENGIETRAVSVEINRFPDSVTYKDWPPVLENIRVKGEPKEFIIWIYGESGIGNFSLRISTGYFRNTGEDYLNVQFSGLQNENIVDEILGFLGLKPYKPFFPEKPPRSAFIAHRFDPEGEMAANRLSRFLTLLKFDVKTGRSFLPKSVSDKAKERIESQSIIFVILTKGSDSTWLTQESIFGLVKDKPVFILLDSKAEFKSGLFGDLEYVPFESHAIEKSFIPVLEGLNELGFLEFESS